MKLKAMLLTAFLLIVLSFAVLGSCAVPDLGLGAGGRLKPCPSSPNCVCSDGASAGEDSFISGLEIPAEMDPAAAFEALAGLVAEQANIVTREPDYLHAVYKTRLLRFRDDFEARLDEAAGVIQVRSASRLGYSDMGVNRRRVEGLRSSLVALWGAAPDGGAPEQAPTGASDKPPASDGR